MHAGWNALVKAGRDRLLTQALVVATGALIAVIAAPFTGAPARPSWPFLALSVSVHLGYFLCLLRAYHFGDLSQVYPLARGTAPLLVALLAALFAHERPGPSAAAGLVLVSLGVVSLAFIGGPPWRGDPRAVLFALATAGLIATYTLCDGLGVRRAGQALPYIVWLNILDGATLCTFAALRRRGRLVPLVATHWQAGVSGGVLATFAYGIAIWAFRLAPLAHVSALRETSVMIAALLGARLFHEPFGRSRIVSATVVASGIVLLSLGS